MSLFEILVDSTPHDCVSNLHNLWLRRYSTSYAFHACAIKISCVTYITCIIYMSSISNIHARHILFHYIHYIISHTLLTSHVLHIYHVLYALHICHEFFTLHALHICQANTYITCITYICHSLLKLHALHIGLCYV